jgi:Tfp pilus assembly protein PilV
MREFRFKRAQRGSSLIEMMIALVVLTVGLIGSMALVGIAIGGNYRSKNDSTSTALAEMVAEKISAYPVCNGCAPTFNVTDCAGNAHSINTAGAIAGSGANLTTSGNIDYTQAFNSVPANYAMRYVLCGITNGAQANYDVRWNIKLLPGNNEESVVVAARMANANTQVTTLNAPAVNVRTIVGNAGN